ncbi:halocyanin domain-containing protein [Halorientalis brevis]|uniref:Halocyanin domain-containing protein n=1 Tax=Halorientalis brevis TaxID=1126241 RepID=A0ABD6CB02_9EURY|nr:halocyanin domain-containing protein [Halorientalis brevis]
MSTNDNTGASTQSRRGFLRATATGAAAAGLGASATGTAAAQDGSKFGGYLAEANNYDGTVVDETGKSEVTVEVGAADTGLAFGPAAVKVDPGTKIVWEWTGDGGSHNVVAEDGSFDSGSAVSQAGTTFEQTFEEEGVVQYFCEPHKISGMKGVIVVGDVDTSGGGGEGGEHGGGIVFTPELQAMGAALALGILSPIVFAVLLALNRDKLGGTEQSGRADRDLKRIE